MDSLCSDLQILVQCLETVAECCLLHHRNVRYYQRNDESLKQMIIDKDWGWILKSIEDNQYPHSLDRIRSFMDQYGDNEMCIFILIRFAAEDNYFRDIWRVLQNYLTSSGYK